MKSPMFAPAAVACLVDGREPRAEEIDQLAAKIWHDVYHRSWKIDWSEVERGSRLYLATYAAALAALGAIASFSPDIMSVAA
ncbi:hypothetical protein [Sphingomonas solaris]|uniref:Uncharacterized protein n=1 Tax=Alterirhizorhabdus solaris TaxID=2529389 RepID=A0A558RD30_9SPHN|nr:hypothetical protein [Sphingomonas solaris]TVV77221.1 hypothetical protein FOY91_01400 [Sphingomonas solaris]